MDDTELANQLVKSIRDAENNERTELATTLRFELAKVNERIVADGFAPVSV